MQYVNGLYQPSSRRCFLADRISISAAAARFLDMTAADAMFSKHVNVKVVHSRNQMDGTFVIERPCNAYYFLEKARRARLPARSAARLSRACFLRNVALRLSSCGFHVRRSINPPHPPTPDSLKRFHRYHDQNTHRTHNNPPTSNMSDYGGGDDEPMDYAMGECASPSRKGSQESCR
jgi:hypothetical protein